MPLPQLKPSDRFYWIGAHELAPDSVIRAANWGSLIKFWGLRHNLAGRELLWEQIRLEVAPDKPSRLRSAFVIPHEASLAIEFRNENNRTGRIFEIELVAPDANHAVADMCWVNLVNNPVREQFVAISFASHGLDQEADWARAYWNGQALADAMQGWPPPFDRAKPELLTESDLRIVKLTDL